MQAAHTNCLFSSNHEQWTSCHALQAPRGCQPAGLAAYSDSELPGPNLPLPCGYSAVAEKLAQGLDITFGWRLAQLEWGSTGGRTSGDGGRSGVVLRSTCGQYIQADAVILTLPLGVLKVNPEPQSLQVRQASSCLSTLTAGGAVHGRPVRWGGSCWCPSHALGFRV